MTASDSSFKPFSFGLSMDDPEALAAAGTDFVILSRDPAETIGASPAVLPILPLKDTVVFPDTMTPLAVGQPRSVALIDDILRGDKQVGLFASKRPDIEVPGPDDVNTIGVLATIQKMIKAPDGTLRIIAQGIRRIEIERFVGEAPYLTAVVRDLPDVVEPGTELEALQRNLISIYQKAGQAERAEMLSGLVDILLGARSAPRAAP